MFVVTVGAVLGLWQATRNPHPLPRDYGADYWWPLWFGLVWGVLVLAHFLVAARLVDLPRSAAWPVPRADSTNRTGSSSHPAKTATVLPLERLTPREREVLVLLTEGYANKDIAGLLFISERTARTHVSNILRKLGLTSRTQAALAASRAGVNGRAGA
jgi:DNA-binding NarL/FixJ family response regulator